MVERCLRDEAGAWEDLVGRYQRYVYAIILKGYRLSDHDAEDAFQEVFLRVYDRLGSLRDPDALRPWIAKLTRRVCLDRLSSRSREDPTEEVEPEAVDRTLDELDEALAVHEALGVLGEPCAEILDRFFVRDESYRTIGEALGLPAGTIASRISRCLAKLRKQFEGRSEAASPSGEVEAHMSRYDEETLARILRLLPPAPPAWVQAARELPGARQALDDLVARAEEDATFRAGVVANLEAALAAEGVEPARRNVEELRRRLDPR